MNTNEASKGLIHIYYGGGKGKTTAATGLACRAAGRGWKVLFCQFMKGSKTGEIVSLESMGVGIIRASESKGFFFNMDKEQKAEYGELQQKLFADILRAVTEPPDGRAPDLIVLDEVLDVLTTGLVCEEDIRALLSAKPKGAELVLTGRKAPAWLEEQASYITEIKKIKHPWDDGIVAREGIEY